MLELKKSVYISSGFNPAENLGLEDYLISICKQDEVILYLWQNRKTIVIGKHQNPYKECNLINLEKNGIHLVRRRSGGGAVFHDLGNLNFTFIAHRENYDQNRHFKVILEALKPWGIEAVQTGRNDIAVDNMKFSGNAFINGKSVQCHHGTLLVDVNMQELGSYLTPPKIKLQDKGIESVRSRVVNLKELNSSLTIEGLKSALVDSFDREYAGSLTAKETPDSSVIADYSSFYADWQWTVAKSPRAAISHSRKFEWGVIVMDLSVVSGVIESCIVSSDSLLDQPFEELAEGMKGLKLKAAEIANVIDDLFSDAKVAEDLKNLVKDFI